MNHTFVSERMPSTMEIKCTNESCFLDMWENHYTYDAPDDIAADDHSCPICGGTDCLEAIEL